MPITDTYLRLPLESIQVDRASRQRREIDTKGLEASIKARGVLTPIIVKNGPEGTIWLVAGERRLQSCRNLGLPDIPVRFAEDLSSTESAIIELEENVKRKDLPWQDLVRAVATIHQLYKELDPGILMSETAENAGLSLSAVSIYLLIEKNLADERISGAKTIMEAYNVLQRRAQRAQGDALEELLWVPPPKDQLVLPLAGGEPVVTGIEVHGLPRPVVSFENVEVRHTHNGTEWAGSPIATPAPSAAPDPIQVGSFLDWAPTYSGMKFNLIHCDFPYGIELFAGEQGKGAEGGESTYVDSQAVFQSLLESLCRNLNSFCALSAHLMFWYSARPNSARELWIRKTFHELAPSWVFKSFPLIWVKSDNAGIASDPRHGPRHVYETCLVGTRGGRQIARVVGDAYSAPTDKKLHPSTKPEPMLRHFMTMLVDQHSRVFDPTAGSGAALRAAESLGATTVFGLEIDPAVAKLANDAIRIARKLRGVST